MNIRVAFVGLGYRGLAAIERFCNIEGAQVAARCDASATQVEEALQIIDKYGQPKPQAYLGEHGYEELCKDSGADVVYICTDWQSHVPIAVAAMQGGKHAAVEVPAATTLDEIHLLIKTAQQTGRHCMMLENCVYDFFELSTLAMARAGLFGEIVHVEGGYAHPIGEKWTPWRLEINRQWRGDVYPTHGLGPLCQLLDLHRSDHMKTLVAMDTAAFTGPGVYEKHMGEAAPDFQNGDQTTTLIRTERGKTMLLQHNVMTPRPYSRLYQIVGTEGYAQKYPEPLLQFSETKLRELGIECNEEVLPASVRDELLKRFLPDYVEQLLPIARQLDPRGGMAYFMDWRLIHCLRNSEPLDMDVYDMAEWCCISELSRRSIENGSTPVAVPDFTLL